MLVARPNWELSFTHQLVANVIFGSVALLALAYCIHVARKEHKRYPLFLFLGAGLTVFYEPINNVLGHCTYGEIGQWTWIDTLGRKIPTCIGAVYFFYFSATILWLVRRIERGLTARQWWRYYAVGVVVCTCFELIPINLDWWKYYGDGQALKVAGFPMWWWFTNPQCLFTTATLFAVLRRYVITDRRSFLFVVLLPMSIFAVHGAAGIPIFTALNTTEHLAVTTLASLGTITLSLMLMWVTSQVVPRLGAAAPMPAPARRREVVPA